MFTFLKSYIAAHGISPTFAECQEALGMKSKNQVTKTLVGLEQRQYIRRFKFLNRGIEIVSEGDAETKRLREIEVAARVYTRTLNANDFAILKELVA
jgi:SOS-response transcriptional repressor LexA